MCICVAVEFARLTKIATVCLSPELTNPCSLPFKCVFTCNTTFEPYKSLYEVIRAELVLILQRLETEVDRVECLFSFTGFFGRIHGIICEMAFVEDKTLYRYHCCQSHASLTWRSWNPEVCFLTSRAAGWFCFNRKVVFYWGLLEYQKSQVNTESLHVNWVCELPLVGVWYYCCRADDSRFKGVGQPFYGGCRFHRSETPMSTPWRQRASALWRVGS